MSSMKRYIANHGLWVLLAAVAFTTAEAATSAADNGPPTMQARLAEMGPEDQHMLMSFTPELRQKFMALSPDVRVMLKQAHGTHTRHSKTLTLRQVMQEMLSEFQGIVAAVATDNAEQAADSARRLANHRIPYGGLLPYFPLDKINTESLSVLPAMNTAVEGAALRLAEAADQGDMAEAAMRMGELASGCVACHQYFRGHPGISPLLLPVKSE